MPRARASVAGLRTDNRRNWGNPDGGRFWKHDDAMHIMTWWNATRKQMTWQRHRITGRHLTHRSRGVTTLHHYERISSRDLGWHRRENRRGRERGKLSCFLDKRVKPWTLRGWTNWKKECNGDERSRKHSVRKEEQGRTTSGSTPIEKKKELDKNLIRWEDTWWNHNTLPPELLNEWNKG